MAPHEQNMEHGPVELSHTAMFHDDDRVYGLSHTVVFQSEDIKELYLLQEAPHELNTE